MPSTRTAGAMVRVPKWLWGADPEGFLRSAELRGRPLPDVSGDPHAASQTYIVRTTESYYRQRPSLVGSITVADSAPRAHFDQLSTFLYADFGPRGTDDELLAALHSPETPTNLAQGLRDIQIRTMTSTIRNLPAVVRAGLSEIRSIPLASGVEARPFEAASVHAVNRRRALLDRTKLASVVLRLTYDKRLAAGQRAHVEELMADGRSVFASSEALYDGIILLDTYLNPLLGALSPAFWAFSCHRAGGAVVYSLGRAVSGIESEPVELLQLLHSRGALESTEVPAFQPSSASAAVHWWSNALNQLFGFLSDPATFVDRDGYYEAGRHLQALLTVEQLFRRVASIQVNYGDSSARRVLLFTVLDTVERLTGRPLERLCSLRFAERTAAKLWDSIPDDARSILLYGVTRGLNALRELAGGFFLIEPDGTLHVDFASSRGRSLDLDAASAQYVKVLRNATHGHGTKRPGISDQTNALLATHNGSIPFDLPLVGYLYLLDILANPENLKRRLESMA